MRKNIFKILVMVILLGNIGFGEYIKKNGRVYIGKMSLTLI